MGLQIFKVNTTQLDTYEMNEKPGLSPSTNKLHIYYCDCIKKLKQSCLNCT